MNRTFILAFWIIFLATFLTACSSRESQIEFQPVDKPGGLDFSPIPGISTSPANSEQCPAGGIVYRIFSDANRNGLLEVGETIMNEQLVCHGTNGSTGENGLTTLFSMDRVTTDSLACESGSGVQLNSGLDLDRNSSLEHSEISQSQILCDGVRGADGAAGLSGPAGSNGHSMVFHIASPSVEQCPTGGSLIMMALDTLDTGVYDVNLPAQQSIALCNGNHGQNGSDAVTPSYSPVAAIQPCGPGGGFKEVLLRLANGQVLASLSNNTAGDMTRLAFLPDGTYTTTDSASCQFSISTAGAQRSISWWNLVQQTWAWLP